MKAFFITIPHSGEQVPPETPWLRELPETVLMCDVDRFVDRLYRPVIQKLNLPHVVTEWHRYVVDLNRWVDDVDASSVQGHPNPPGKFWNGLHWIRTTRGQVLMPEPMPEALHKQLVQKYFQPFHEKVRSIYADFHARGAKEVFHLDAHSMPSVGTPSHRDPGEVRADIVISDCEGKSCSADYKDLVIRAYQCAGFRVAYNWPYVGGRVTQTYGQPKDGHHAIQVEISRRLYMDEETKQWLPEKAEALSAQLTQAVEHIFNHLPESAA